MFLSGHLHVSITSIWVVNCKTLSFLVEHMGIRILDSFKMIKEQSKASDNLLLSTCVFCGLSIKLLYVY